MTETEKQKPLKNKPSARPIGKTEIEEAARVLQRYRDAKAGLDGRITDNNVWYASRHAPGSRKSSRWAFNSIIAKHADFTDSIPECTVLPRESDDSAEAEKLTGIIPVILDLSGWDRVYSDAAWDKIKNGTALYSVLWDPAADSGLGGIAVKKADIRNLFWEPGVTNLQKSRSVFFTTAVPNEVILEKYPFAEGHLQNCASETFVPGTAADGSGKSTVVDWYYKKRSGNRELLHYCKFVNDCLLYSSENDPACKGGWYAHGQYPFITDTLFPSEGSPAGFGFIDVMRGLQDDIDILGEEMLKNARLSARRRFFVRNDGSVNEEEFADVSADFVHVNSSSLGIDSIREIEVRPMGSDCISMLSHLINELKETSGNRDFSQGSVSGGVTSGTAITALQEAGGKLSRDMIAGTYDAFSQIVLLIIELIRQFYSLPRTFRITDAEGGISFGSYSNKGLTEPGGSPRKPLFDVKVKAHRRNAFSRQQLNSDAVNFFNMGFFDPARYKEALACLELTDIENKEKIKQMIKENGENDRGLL